ncbi:unnamed protein product [Mycena citricolor]|uniref:DDE-1 domain-containing protein n=1 Tax=Mycena citricolor TaxID=2018698 RepID=A0AAD2GRE0_9AGAR|nr:unnamed protein product [Mycena citricolor]
MGHKKKHPPRARNASGHFVRQNTPVAVSSDPGEESEWEHMSDHDRSDDEDFEMSDEESDLGSKDGDAVEDDDSLSDSGDELDNIAIPSVWLELADLLTGDGMPSQIITVNSVLGAEKVFDGPRDREAKLGVKRGLYGIGGDSEKTLRTRRRRVEEAFERGTITSSQRQVQLQGISMNAAPKTKADKKLTSFFQRLKPHPRVPLPTRSPSPGMPASVDSEADTGHVISVPILRPTVEDEDNIPSSRPGGTLPIRAGVPIVALATEFDDRGNVLPQYTDGDDPEMNTETTSADLDSVNNVDDAADWIDGVLGEEEEQTDLVLQLLCAESLKMARKAKNYRAEVVWATLVSFYSWKGRLGRGKTSLRCAKTLGRGPAFARVICGQARHVEATGALKVFRQGKRKNKSGHLMDEGFSLGMQRWLRTRGTGQVTPQLLRDHVNTTLLPSLMESKKTSISTRQACRWLYILGYRRKQHQKGVYWDGHERTDVRKHRKFIPLYDGPEMAETTTAERDAQGKEHVFIYQDESAFHANDFQNVSYYLLPGEQVLKKKEQGRLIMASRYICERYGNIALTETLIKENEKLPADQRLEVVDSSVVICPNNKATGDNYWNMDQMIAQLHNAIKIAKRLYPNAQLHWVFDNSSCHGSLPHDAIAVTKMNVGPGGRVDDMHNTIIPLSNPHGKGGTVQSMQFPVNLPDDHPDKAHAGKAKGMRRILEERGYNTQKLIGQCKQCKQEHTRKPNLTGLSPDDIQLAEGDDGNDSEEDEEQPVNCCLRRLLENEEDIKNQTVPQKDLEDAQKAWEAREEKYRVKMLNK